MRHFVLFIKPGLVTRYMQLRVPYVVGLPLGVGLFFSVILASSFHMLDRVPLHGMNKFCLHELMRNKRVALALGLRAMICCSWTSMRW